LELSEAVEGLELFSSGCCLLINVLNEATRLNGLNDLNGLRLPLDLPANERPRTFLGQNRKPPEILVARIAATLYKRLVDPPLKCHHDFILIGVQLSQNHLAFSQDFSQARPMVVALIKCRKA
jgi:hypothetical protein